MEKYTLGEWNLEDGLNKFCHMLQKVEEAGEDPKDAGMRPSIIHRMCHGDGFIGQHINHAMVSDQLPQ